MATVFKRIGFESNVTAATATARERRPNRHSITSTLIVYFRFKAVSLNRNKNIKNQFISYRVAVMAERQCHGETTLCPVADLPL